jgi:hypothetical protein
VTEGKLPSDPPHLPWKTLEAAAQPLWPLPGTSAIDAVRSLPHWEKAPASPMGSRGPSSAERWDHGREERLAAFGQTKQWKTLSLQEAAAQYGVRKVAA